MEIKIGFCSDLHTLHNDWHDNLMYGQWGHELEQKWNELDILIFSGDCTSRGYDTEVKNFLHWFNEQPAMYKVMVAGNHDFWFDPHHSNGSPFIDDVYREQLKFIDYNKRAEFFTKQKNKYINKTLEDFPNIIYLNDESTEIMGLKIWGSPIQPWFHDWAFNRQRGEEIKKHWDMIPNDADIVITHGPPRGILDRISPKFERYNENPNVGCDDLLEAIQRVKPKVSVFGHIHEGYGKIEKDGTTFINASCLTDNYKPMNPPQFLTLEI